MSGVRRQLKVSSLRQLSNLLIKPTGFVILPVPEDQVPVLHASDDVLADHEHWAYLSLCYVQLLADYYQVQVELFGVVDEDRIGALDECFEGGSKRKQEDRRFWDEISWFHEFLNDWSYFQYELVEHDTGVDLLNPADINRIVLRALVGEVIVLKRRSLARVAGLVIESLIVGILKEAAFDLVDINLIGSDTAYR